MPVTKSAQKKMRADVKRRARNVVTIRKMKTAIKNLKKLAASNPSQATEALKSAYSAVDTAFKKKIIHRNNAANKKSRLAKLVARSLEVSAKPA